MFYCCFFSFPSCTGSHCMAQTSAQSQYLSIPGGLEPPTAHAQWKKNYFEKGESSKQWTTWMDRLLQYQSHMEEEWMSRCTPWPRHIRRTLSPLSQPLGLKKEGLEDRCKGVVATPNPPDIESHPRGRDRGTGRAKLSCLNWFEGLYLEVLLSITLSRGLEGEGGGGDLKECYYNARSFNCFKLLHAFISVM